MSAPPRWESARARRWHCSLVQLLKDREEWVPWCDALELSQAFRQLCTPGIHPAGEGQQDQHVSGVLVRDTTPRLRQPISEAGRRGSVEDTEDLAGALRILNQQRQRHGLCFRQRLRPSQQILKQFLLSFGYLRNYITLKLMLS